MNQASSHSSMTRSTAEALKQIQKQGLSISLVTDNSRSSQPLESPGSKEMKPKHLVDITPKLPNRSMVVTESKAALSQSRSMPNSATETRVSIGQAPNQSLFQDIKTTSSINKTVVPISSGPEPRAFGQQSWSNPPSTENKAQPALNRTVQNVGAHSESKNFSGRLSQGIVFTENKIQNSKVGLNVAEVKGQSRISQANCHTDPKHTSNMERNQLSFEGKVQNNQSRTPLNSPPLEKKILNTSQTRQGQNFAVDNKTPLTQRTIAQTTGSQSKLVSNKVGNIKLPTQLLVKQIVKGTPAERIQQPKAVDQSSGQASNFGLHNPFRVASTSIENSSVAMEQNTTVKVNRLAQSTIQSRNQSSTLTKKILNTSMQSESSAVSQVIKMASRSSINSPKAVPLDTITQLPPGLFKMSTSKATPKRNRASALVASSPASKKKCAKRNGSEQEADLNNQGAKTPKGIGMQSLHRGLTITPVANSVCSTTSTTSRKTMGSASPLNDGSMVVVCPKCKKHSCDFKQCDNCKSRLPVNSQKFIVKKVNRDIPSMVVTKNVTTTSTIEKKIVYNFNPETMTGEKSHYFETVQRKELFETSTPLRGGKGRGKGRRKAEPVCYTLSSDEEEAPFNPLDGPSLQGSQIYPVESDLSKSEHSSGSEMAHEDHVESDDPQYPGVTDINPNLDFEEEPDDEMEYDGEEMMEEEEEDLPHEDVEEMVNEEDEEEEEEEEQETYEVVKGSPTDYPLKCRSIRVGSHKVHPHNCLFVPVILSSDSISFTVPLVDDPKKRICITLGLGDIVKMYCHFGRCLPIIFIYTTNDFGELVRNALHMTPNGNGNFDPSGQDDKTQKLTFLIESMTEDQKNFIRQTFPGEKKVIEIDQKAANEILVRSTPSTQTQMVKLCFPPQPTPPPIINNTPEMRLPHVPNQISVTKVNVPPQPVVKLLTYPAPPLTGGIAITNEDVNCLNDSEFLNDAIIDFYLKYLFHEKLSPSFRDKVHIFSSFFYPRLTHKPERARAGDDGSKPMQVRRHNQVKTWTRHVDIFSKDYIIIPVNQNVHWFLALIMFPSRVPDAPDTNTSDSVTSTDEPGNVHNVTIQEINSNGEDDSPLQDDSSMNSDMNSPYEVESPCDSDDGCVESPDSTTHPDGKTRKEMPCICIFDSLMGPSRSRIPTILREYLEMEWKNKKGTRKVFDKNTMQGFNMKCPQQTNYSDCGIYLLQYVESFFENTNPLGVPMPNLENWFTEEKVNKKRQQLKDLILSIQKKQEAAASRKLLDKNNQSSSSRQQNDNR